MPVKELLSKDYAARRRWLIGEKARGPRTRRPFSRRDRLPVCGGRRWSDGWLHPVQLPGVRVGIVVPGTGCRCTTAGPASVWTEAIQIAWAGEAALSHDHTGFLTRDGEAVGPYGVMGGFMQPQGHMQMVVNTVDYGMNPQASLDAPRWQWIEGRTVEVEADADPAIIEGLRAKGHDVRVAEPGGGFGRGEITWRLPSGAYAAGSDKRADGYAAGIGLCTNKRWRSRRLFVLDKFYLLKSARARSSQA